MRIDWRTALVSSALTVCVLEARDLFVSPPSAQAYSSSMLRIIDSNVAYIRYDLEDLFGWIEEKKCPENDVYRKYRDDPDTIALTGPNERIAMNLRGLRSSLDKQVRRIRQTCGGKPAAH